MQIPPKYNHIDTEKKWYSFWMNNKLFKSVPNNKEPFTIVIPPPNVTGLLHMGHMLNNDTMSYFFGSYFGKTKMKIKASPNKTWEGFIGGLLCSIIFSIISFTYIQEIYPFWKTLSLGT